MTWQPDYITSVELKSYLHVQNTDDDVQIAMYVTTASRSVDGFCGRQFGVVAVPEARTYQGVWDRSICRYVYDIDDVQTVAGLVVVDANGTVITDYKLGPVNALQQGRPYEQLIASVGPVLTITALWGWTSVPVPVKNATLLQSARFAARRDSPFGVAGSPAIGSEIRLLASLDPDVRVALSAGYRRKWWAA